MLHIAFFRSDVPHANIRSIDIEAARNIAGVVDVFTANDLADLVRPIFVEVNMPGYQACEYPVLAKGKACFVGQPVAAVVAESRYEVEDGVDAIVADYELLPPVLDIDQASEPGSAILHDSVPDNLFNHFTLAEGDVAAAMARADHIVELEIHNGRCAQVPLESRVIVAEWDELYEELAITASHQAPHVFRTGLAEFLQLPESRIRVTSPDVGGGFGSKLIVYPEDLVACVASRRVGRPVRWICDRREDLLASMQGREQIHRIKAAVDKFGRVEAVHVTIKASNGAYPIWPM